MGSSIVHKSLMFFSANWVKTKSRMKIEARSAPEPSNKAVTRALKTEQRLDFVAGNS